MKKASDSKVIKTLLRNYELKVNPSAEQVVLDVACSSTMSQKYRSSEKENELRQPSLCSSEALANYLTSVKNTIPPHTTEDMNIDKGKRSAKVTKKLNFHFNDKIYKNLIELNSNINEVKNKRDRHPSHRPSSIKKDLEPNIEDFYEDENERDTPPTIPVSKLNFKPVKKVEDGSLHKLVAAFEDL